MTPNRKLVDRGPEEAVRHQLVTGHEAVWRFTTTYSDVRELAGLISRRSGVPVTGLTDPCQGVELGCGYRSSPTLRVSLLAVDPGGRDGRGEEAF